MKRQSKEVRELLKELHYHQTMVRVDIRAAQAGIRKCREIGEKIRKAKGKNAGDT